ncbi:transposase [Streptomyces sp. RP5T]|uniref:transposase n=1 Tax=Streptomyces sp. RP5T TaxID=2490848 RepID=UPI000F64C0A7|nr:transposase [Streptomyces sp. RP5T]RRR77254.1 hypothetical protein EHS43_28805 [Streptomyces sp. RP5T]
MLSPYATTRGGGSGVVSAQVRDRGRAAHAPDERASATKPDLAKAMALRAIASPQPIAWVTADAAYGQEGRLSRVPEETGVANVLAIPSPSRCRTSGIRTAYQGWLRLVFGRPRGIKDSNLTDPDLSPATPARELKVSVRTLYRAFTETDDSVVANIGRRCLEQSRLELTSPGTSPPRGSRKWPHAGTSPTAAISRPQERVRSDTRRIRPQAEVTCGSWAPFGDGRAGQERSVGGPMTSR